MLALALALTGLTVVPSSAAEAADSTVIAPGDQRWWTGQDIALEVSVTRDGSPGTGYVGWLEDGRGALLRHVALVDGRATVVIPSRYFSVGTHVIEARHLDTSSGVDPQTGQWPYYSTDSVTIEVAEPARPVLDATSWYYGEEHQLRFDVTGTDQPREGTVTASFDDAERSAPLVDGVATFALDGTEVSGGENLRFTHTSASGARVSAWSFQVMAESKPITLEADVPAVARYGSDVVVPIRVTSPLGTPTGRVFVERDETLASGVLVGGKATLKFPASRLPFGKGHVAVRFNGLPGYEQKGRSFAVDVRPRATSVAVSTPKAWTYGKSRRVSVTVSSPSGTPSGRVELWRGGSKLRSATLTRGKASLPVSGTRVPSGRQSLVVKYVGPSTYARSQRAWTQKVVQARPVVTFRMERTSFPSSWRSTRSVAATVTVRTPGLPERGRLCIWSRNPVNFHGRWSECWTNWSWKVTDGKRTIRVPGRLLQGNEGRSFLKLQYFPRNGNVRTVFSPTITLRHNAP
ncbi:Ig-like domain-containing protein [Isoptericola hypogeus]